MLCAVVWAALATCAPLNMCVCVCVCVRCVGVSVLNCVRAYM